MNSLNTLIKWPGGKSHEIKFIDHLIPQYNRYIEPFFGGGAMFFYLQPHFALINDISPNLIDFYKLTKNQDKEFKKFLLLYCSLLDKLLEVCDNFYENILDIYFLIKSQNFTYENRELDKFIDFLCSHYDAAIVEDLILDLSEYKSQVYYNVIDKMQRTKKNEIKNPFTASDLKENLITGFTSGTYMYFRNVYNDILLGRNKKVSIQYRCANFYFIREYCYGSMFRYNSKGEFNIPYGGMSYNRKDFKGKVFDIFNSKTEALFSNTQIYCKDFEDFFSSVDIDENDFMFLDPPYDTDFSDYEGRAFTQHDQQRLAEALKKTKAKFILIIKNTDFIYSLYNNYFNILCFDKTYTYNVRSRNERNVEHLIITNISSL